MPWRYQPVYVEENGERIYSMCEVHFDKDDNFTHYTDAQIAPAGESVDALSKDLVTMAVDAWSWEPVEFSQLQAGFKFEPRLPLDQRCAIADYLDNTVDTFKNPKAKAHN